MARLTRTAMVTLLLVVFTTPSLSWGVNRRWFLKGVAGLMGGAASAPVAGIEPLAQLASKVLATPVQPPVAPDPALLQFRAEQIHHVYDIHSARQSHSLEVDQMLHWARLNPDVDVVRRYHDYLRALEEGYQQLSTPEGYDSLQEIKLSRMSNELRYHFKERISPHDKWPRFAQQLVQVEVQIAKKMGISLSDAYRAINVVLRPGAMVEIAYNDTLEQSVSPLLYTDQFRSTFLQELASIAPATALSLRGEDCEDNKDSNGIVRAKERLEQLLDFALEFDYGENPVSDSVPDRSARQKPLQFYFWGSNSWYRTAPFLAEQPVSQKQVEEYAQNYIRRLPMLASMKASFARMGPSSLRDGMLRFTAQLEARFILELETLPQRIDAALQQIAMNYQLAEEERGERRKSRKSRKNGSQDSSQNQSAGVQRAIPYESKPRVGVSELEWIQFVNRAANAAGMIGNLLAEPTEASTRTPTQVAASHSSCQGLLTDKEVMAVPALSAPKEEPLPVHTEQATKQPVLRKD